MVGNIDQAADGWGDRFLQKDLNTLTGGLHDPSLVESGFLKGVFLGTVVMGHVAKFVEQKKFQELVSSAAEMMLPGGRIVMIEAYTTPSVIIQTSALMHRAGADPRMKEMVFKREVAAFQFLRQLARQSKGELVYKR